IRRTLLTVSDESHVSSGRTMNSRMNGITSQRGYPGGPHSLRFSSYEMPLASFSAPCFNIAAVAGVSFGITPPGLALKNVPPPEVVHSPDQSGSCANGGLTFPPPAAFFSVAYRSDAVLCATPIWCRRSQSADDCRCCCCCCAATLTTAVAEAAAMSVSTTSRLRDVMPGSLFLVPCVKGSLLYQRHAPGTF